MPKVGSACHLRLGSVVVVIHEIFRKEVGISIKVSAECQRYLLRHRNEEFHGGSLLIVRDLLSLGIVRLRTPGKRRITIKRLPRKVMPLRTYMKYLISDDFVHLTNVDMVVDDAITKDAVHEKFCIRGHR